MKYVMMRDEVTEFLHPIVFDDSLVHLCVAQGARRGNPNLRVIGAGFLERPNGQDWVACGDSDSLRVGPSPGDTAACNLFMREGISGRDLANLITLVELKGYDTVVAMVKEKRR